MAIQQDFADARAELAVAAAAHEVRGALCAPLAALRAILHPAGLPAGDQERMLRAAVRELEDLSSVVDRLLRRPAEGPSVALDVTDVVPMLHEAAMVSTTHPVVVEAPERCLAWIDPPLLRRVLANLVRNAEQHSPSDAVIQIRQSVVRRHVLVSVRDRGSGIPADRLEEVFQPGVRFRTGDGAGLGLHIVRQIVHAHGGDVWAEMRGGGGASICFTLAHAGGDNL